MAYDGRLLRRARERYEADKETRRNAYTARREEIFRRQPRLREVDSRLRAAAGHVLAAALRKGTDPRPAVRRVQEENLRLQEEKKQLLSQMGLPPDALDEFPRCPLCGDSGYRDDQLCPRCLRKYYAREEQKELSRMLDLGNQRFETFSLSLYSDRYDDKYGISPRKNMEQIRDICWNYARNFSAGSGNLLMIGPPGLGKTFLSAAIAREVSGKGFSVVYDTSGQIFQRFEARKFSREEAAEDDVARVFRCDLLILDDLGTEMTTTFVQSALYEIVNTRLLRNASSILSTNLVDEKELFRRYTPQIVSRLKGEYQFLPFFGEDIRKWKKERQIH